MRIVDCFPYFNEKELLELRLKLLYDYVDKFIICDADRIHSGKPKPFLCKDVIKDFGISMDKIEVLEINLPGGNIHALDRERIQRNYASKYIKDDDIFFVSDCDEIINPKYLKYYSSVASNNPNNILRVPLVLLNVRADFRVYDNMGVSRDWSVPYFCMKHHLQKYTISDIRESKTMNTHIDFSDIFVTENNKIIESGWHFSWMGDLDRMKLKCSSFSHHNEVNVVDDYNSLKLNSTDPLGRNDHILKLYDINLLPSKLFELDRVKNFLLPDE